MPKNIILTQHLSQWPVKLTTCPGLSLTAGNGGMLLEQIVTQRAKPEYSLLPDNFHDNLLGLMKIRVMQTEKGCGRQSF
jgi:hypothetical protein